MGRYAIQLRYADTDQMGYIYFARHLVYADEAVTISLREAGLDVGEMERRGLYMAVVAAEASYESPLRYGESCEVEVQVERVGNTSVSFRFKLFGDGQPKSSGKIVYVFVDKEGKKVPVPPQLKAAQRDPEPASEASYVSRDTAKPK